MALRLFNTLTRKKEEFTPLHEGEVRMYNCGPTVYDFAHIGNFRSYIFADLLKRYLEYRGYKVRQVMNITDVGHLTEDVNEGEDKMELGAKREKLDPWQIAEKYMNAFFEDRDRLNISHAEVYPRATEYVPKMIAMVEKLIENGHAYEVNGCVYYDVTTFPSYGQLSGNTLSDLEAGKRIEVHPDKRNPQDFALWVTDPKHLMKWESPWGEGYPGWHIECCAMSTDILGNTLDIHTGGEDNIFPHHECEIAQAEGATGEKFVRTWMHARFLLVDGRKMSKSLGNFYTLRNLEEKGHNPLDIRYELLSTHYRQQLNLTAGGLESAAAGRKRLHDFLVNMADVNKEDESGEVEAIAQKAKAAFTEALDDDLNVSAALGVVFDFVHDVNRAHPGMREAALAADTMRGFDRVLGVLDEGGDDIPQEILDAVQARENARKNKDFAGADRIRDELLGKGYTIEDTPDGPRCRRT